MLKSTRRGDRLFKIAHFQIRPLRFRKRPAPYRLSEFIVTTDKFRNTVFVRAMSVQGQSEKKSVRVYVSRFALKLGHSSTRRAIRIRANSCHRRPKAG